jgi:quercetin dioxygenase-like cupin family protein
MIVAGQTVENPQTGERLVFHKTARDTGGEYTQFEAFIAPGGHLPAAHIHPSQSERFEITSGTLTLKIDGKLVEAKQGDVVTIEPGQRHNFWNRTDGEVSFKVEVRPALKIESVIETMYGLAADGKTNRFGMPNPLRLAVIAEHHFDTVQLPLVPVAAQRAAVAVGASIGRMLGFGSTYSRRPVAAPAPVSVPVPAFAGRRPALAVA